MDQTIEGNLYLNKEFQHGCLGISDGKIISIKKTLKSENHHDFGNNLILPAGIDIHVHFRDPGHLYKETFFTGSRAAAFGGITTVFDMPNTTPPTTTPAALKEKQQIASKKSVVDFGLYAGITDANKEHIQQLSPFCNGFKAYLGSSTNALLLNEQHLKEVFQHTNQTNKPILFHAESNNCLQNYTKQTHSLQDHMNSRPAICEEHAIQQIITASSETKQPIHICHLSSVEGLIALKKRPSNITVGITPHHLLLDLSNIKKNHQRYKVNPPLRTSLDRETLWNGLLSRTIDIIESDHAPHTLEEKTTEFSKTPSGIPGVETLYPLLLAFAQKQYISFQTVISCICEKPAQLFKLPKGEIKTGNDADLVIIDHKKQTKIQPQLLHSQCGWSVFEGYNALFPRQVFLRGETLIENNELLVKQGFGKQILVN